MPQTYPEFLDFSLIAQLKGVRSPDEHRLDEILDKATLLNGLSLEDAAVLLAVQDPRQIQRIMTTAKQVKQAIYGNRIVIFAPLYIGNHCVNNCLYCGFRKDNKVLKRAKLTQDQVHEQTSRMLNQGHKRIVLLFGEGYNLSYLEQSINTIYKVREGASNIRRINVEVAPLDVEGFSRLKQCDIGTYICFQETYDPGLYKHYHPSGPKSDYQYRLFCMHRAMAAGIDDVGIGALLGLADYKLEVLSMLQHAKALETHFGCGPHTISVPRIEPADGAPLSSRVPHLVSDDAFRIIIAVLRLTLPYTGIILSTREKVELRRELFQYGVSQISAGSATSIGGYSEDNAPDTQGGSQFALGDCRPLETVIRDLIQMEFIPSFCTGCYRRGRVGKDFMDLAKPGLIKLFCHPNGIMSFAEYLEDYATADTRKKGYALIEKMQAREQNDKIKTTVDSGITQIQAGKRDLFV
ncbi:[FeFe] hydrogenase H-cluster radical SAM maturase HydG [Desulforhopalus singaporensis]|uniref:Iron-only hydrogenase maturation protein HydG n=1 Tax=Desulforhopalus singaporensis TaxID=91360 RepID=A0A1H0T731_9BACT|nr:[FeFe] hydrogenase H-cluster radical SAM maturase HydG [Desulforhopalus singaporensis]SDP49408.1 iron-only hydrogenase maturation protein HydG [Desulforhopalus singaporensis]